jgi:diadenosine tetraphosphate (Ap4A) HIT family hydrolase
MENVLYESKTLKVIVEPFEIPWVKVFTVEPHKEFSECSLELRMEILNMLDIVEKEMIQYFNPDKINIASFGNYLPHVHFHIQARFQQDSYFPESTWGKKMRQSDLKLDLEQFYIFLKHQLERIVR